MRNIVQFESRSDRVGGLRAQIDEHNRRIDETIAAAGDEALVEVHSTLSHEMAVGTIPLHYSNLLDKLQNEIARRGLNVVPLRKGEATA